jgi:ribosome biogenesis protein ERB1
LSFLGFFADVLEKRYLGHTDIIRSLDISPDGQWLVTGSDDKTVRVWDVETGRCVHIFHVDSIVNRVAWNPNSSVCIVAAALENGVLLLTVPPAATAEQAEQTLSLFRDPEKKSPHWSFFAADSEQYRKGFRMYYKTGIKVNSVSWHRKVWDFLFLCLFCLKRTRRATTCSHCRPRTKALRSCCIV